MFKATNISNMKRFFEGKGYVTRTMYNQPSIEFIGAYVFVTSNGLPALSKDEDHSYDWEAIKARVSFVETKTSFEDKGKDAFPFNYVVLGHYLSYLVSTFDECNHVPDSYNPLELKPSVPICGT
jgi:hypothetical protein